MRLSKLAFMVTLRVGFASAGCLMLSACLQSGTIDCGYLNGQWHCDTSSGGTAGPVPLPAPVPAPVPVPATP